MARTELELGDSVVVRQNFKDPDFTIKIGGWQGRITGIQYDDLIGVSWDSLTLKKMPSKFIDKCEEEGLSWTQTYLYPKDLKITTPRDNEKDVEEIINFLESKHAWSHHGEEGIRIQAVLKKAKDD